MVTDVGTSEKPVCKFRVLIYVQSRTVFKLLQIIRQIFAVDRGVSH